MGKNGARVSESTRIDFAQLSKCATMNGRADLLPPQANPFVEHACQLGLAPAPELDHPDEAGQ